ncbi:hypothetical protein CDN99_25880 [Roseateles aquatilis]|uniref:Type 4 fimbrial biogenesis protein PilX N-terminal domain-containing protein n=1 Tax=Roseateles aquatilis TaxID=431061 RepID=A0A246ITM4_9BURK|nr:hypothetical protein [Roseateles aquatilis]OWQ83565.1 hypothetical protein CDN99_25880 [Roseateles aquatilis]
MLPPSLRHVAPIARRRAASRERGVIMVIALITLAVLLIGAAATMRSMNVSLLNAGNFGFKRDMANQAERAIRAATTSLATGNLSTAASRQSSNAAFNYSATLLASDASGIPTAMLNMTDVDGLNGAGNVANAITLPDDGIQLHYLIERLCSTAGAFSVGNCQVLGRSSNSGSNLKNPVVPPQPTYRITVRVRGPHNAYSFYQTTFTTQN